MDGRSIAIHKCGGIDEMKDYCNYSPDGWWGSSCQSHDKSYWKIKQLRKVADENLREDMRRLKAPKFMPEIYYFFTRIFGRLFV